MGAYEHNLSRRVARWAKKNGIFAVKQTGNGHAGMPDWLFVVDGRAVFVELKAPNGRLRPAQKVYHAIIERNACAPVFVCRTLDDVISVICNITNTECN